MTEDIALTSTYDNLPPALKETLSRYGVIPEDVGKTPEVNVVKKVNLDELCVVKTPVRDQGGDAINCLGHTGTLVYLKTGEPNTAETRGEKFKNRYQETAGFMVYTIYHPEHGEMVFTHGIPKDGPSEVMRFMATLLPGNYFQIAAFPTSGGNRLFKPIPVQ